MRRRTKSLPCCNEADRSHRYRHIVRVWIGCFIGQRSTVSLLHQLRYVLEWVSDFGDPDRRELGMGRNGVMGWK